MDNFPKKYASKLPTGFAEDAEGLSIDELKKIILTCQNHLYTAEKEMEADQKLNAAKAVVKDISEPYRDAMATQRAKLKYCLYLMEARGEDLSGGT